MTERNTKHETRNSKKKGVAVLLLVVIVSALTSMSVGIFNIILGQILISGEINDSYVAFYSADQEIERLLYRDRIQKVFPAPGNTPDPASGLQAVVSTACFAALVEKTINPTTTRLTATGEYPNTGSGNTCGAHTRKVKRRLEVTY